ncbi:MAG TPA: hypothetical protein VJ810_31725 [Blastocatellia bacterium]|nr:hypothetical protein [Blastocatellia bacterium]
MSRHGRYQSVFGATLDLLSRRAGEAVESEKDREIKDSRTEIAALKAENEKLRAAATPE